MSGGGATLASGPVREEGLRFWKSSPCGKCFAGEERKVLGSGRGQRGKAESGRKKADGWFPSLIWKE